MKAGRLMAGLTIALALVFSAACGSSSSAHVENTDPLVFPTFNPFTGADAVFGPEMRAGCPAATRSVMAAGGVLGHKQLQCPVVDSRGDPADAVPAAQRMLLTHNLMMVLGPSSDEASATVPLINAAKIPMFVDTGQPSFDQNSFDYFWRITPSDDYYGYAMALYAWDAGYRKAAMVFGNDISSQGTVPTIMKGFQKLGGQIVVNKTLTIGQSSYRSEAQQVAASNPDVIFNEMDPQTAATFFGQLKEVHGGLFPFVSTGAQYQPWLDAVSGTVGTADLAKYYHSVLGGANFSGPAWEEYNKNLLASGADVPTPEKWSNDIYSATSYDSVIMSCLAMVAAGTTDPKVWNGYIPKVTNVTSGATVVHTFAEGAAALAAGKTIAYEGAGSAVAFDKWHNSSGGFEVLGYAAKEGTQPILRTYPAGAVNQLIS